MRRTVTPEEMDDEAIAPKDHIKALKGLARINLFSGAAHILWPAIEALAREMPDKPLRVLDIATGSGDIPTSLWKMARKKRILLEIAGCDKSSQALDFARTQAQEKGAQVLFFKLDIHHDEIPDGYDILISSLFLHHLENDKAVQFLKRMAKQAKRLVLVNDLTRTLLGFALAFLGTRLLTASPIVHTDGVLSAQAAFSLPEIKKAAHAAGLIEARVKRRWPSRFLLIWKKEEV